MLRAEVARDVAKQIARNDHLKLRRIADHLHQRIIDIHVARFDLGIFAADLLEDALPQIVAEGERVGLVAMQTRLSPRCASKLKRVAENPLDALARVDVFLRRNFVRQFPS